MSLLEARDLRFAYGHVPILRGVSLHVDAGQVVALLGPNGAGKSTLIRVLLGQLRASGQVLWDGRDVQSWSRRELARRVAYLPQSPVFEPDQLVSDVLRTGRAPYWGAFGLESDRDIAVVQDVSHQLKMESLLPRPVGALSGGQRQRVFIGRCLVQEPAALLLDEPNTFLDLRHQAELMGILRDLAQRQGMAILMASHDLNLSASSADRMVLLHEGSAVSDGLPDQVLDPTVLARVYGVEMRRIDPPEGGHPIVYPIVGQDLSGTVTTT